MYPSMRSKLLQKALNGPSPKMSARNTIMRNAPMPHRKSELFGRNDGSLTASRSQHAKITSTMMRNAKFFPVINGKNSGAATMSGTNGTRKTPIFVTHKSTLSIVCIRAIVTQQSKKAQNTEHKKPNKGTNYSKHKITFQF